MKLDKKIKSKWIEALRSKKYKQGKSSLYNKESNTFCCLGVLGEICGISRDILEDRLFLQNFKGVSKVPPMLRGNTNIPYELAKMNDGLFGNYKKTFKGIATYIEKNL